MADALQLHAMQSTVKPKDTQWAHRFALKLIAQYYGDINERVAETLLKHGRMSLHDLCQMCNSQWGHVAHMHVSRQPVCKQDIRKALLILIQHNLVNIYHDAADIEKTTNPTGAVYEADIDRMLQIVRIRRFVEYIEETFTDDNSKLYTAIISTMLQGGRMRADQIVRHVLEDASSTEQVPNLSHETVLASLKSLVSSRFVEKVPPCSLPPPRASVHANAQMKRGVTSKPKPEEILQQSIDSKRNVWNQGRFQWNSLALATAPTNPALAIPEEQDIIEEDGVDVTNPMHIFQASIRSSTQAFHRLSLETDRIFLNTDKLYFNIESASETDDEHEGVDGNIIEWRVNFDEFNRRFRNKTILDTFGIDHTEDEVAILRACLNVAGPLEEMVQLEFTPAVSIEVIHQTLAQERGVLPISRDDLKSKLDTIMFQDLNFISDRGTSPSGDLYCVNIEIALKLAKLRYVLAFIREKFGQPAARIWNMLFIEGQMEQEKIADTLLVSRNTANKALYGMLKAGLLALQNAPRSASRAASNTVFTWRANIDSACTQLAIDLYRSVGNIHKVLTKHLEDHADLAESVTLVNKGELPPTAVHNDERFVKFKSTLTILQNSLYELDKEIALFNDF